MTARRDPIGLRTRRTTSPAASKSSGLAAVGGLPHQDAISRHLRREEAAVGRERREADWTWLRDRQADEHLARPGVLKRDPIALIEGQARAVGREPNEGRMISFDGPVRRPRGPVRDVPHVDGLPSSGMIAGDSQATAVGLEAEPNQRLAGFEIESRPVPVSGHFEEVDSVVRGSSVERGDVTAVG